MCVLFFAFHRHLYFVQVWYAVGKSIEKHTNRKQSPPPWIEQCRLYVGSTSREYIQDNGQVWDVHKLTQMLRGHWDNVFVHRLGYDKDSAKGKELFETLLQIQQRRHTRAHQVVPTESEVLQALRHMLTALEMFSGSAWDMAVPIGQIRGLLREAQAMMRIARQAAASKGSPAVPSVPKTLSKEEFDILGLFLSLLDFETGLEDALGGGIGYLGGKVVVGEDVQAWFSTDEGKPALTRFIAEQENFEVITSARHW